jgi:hypothetical protein
MKTFITQIKECAGDCNVAMKLFMLTMGIMVIYGIGAAILFAIHDAYKTIM